LRSNLKIKTNQMTSWAHTRKAMNNIVVRELCI